MATTLNIYDISTYAAGTTYSLDEIVKQGDKYYYSLRDGNVGNTPAVNSVNWGGYTYNTFGDVKPYFYWKPSYGTSIDQTPNTLYLQLGDSYQVRMKKNINNTLLFLSLQFNDVTTNRAAAISHFLFIRQSVESFIFTSPPPFSKPKLFICKNWKINDVFYNNHSINVDFEEVPI